MFYPVGKNSEKPYRDGRGGRWYPPPPPPLVLPRVDSRTRISDSNAMRTQDPGFHIILGAMSDIYEPNDDK